MGSQEGAGWAELWVKRGSVLPVALLSSHCSLGLGRSGGAAPEKELNGNGSRVAGRRSRGGVECQQLGHNPQGQCKHLAFDSSYEAGGER